MYIYMFILFYFFSDLGFNLNKCKLHKSYLVYSFEFFAFLLFDVYICDLSVESYYFRSAVWDTQSLFVNVNSLSY